MLACFHISIGHRGRVNVSLAYIICPNIASDADHCENCSCDLDSVVSICVAPSRVSEGHYECYETIGCKDPNGTENEF